MLRVQHLLPILLALLLGGEIVATSDLGSGRDPDGRPAVDTADLGSIMDPDG
jgi:hypothetical protein